MMSRNNLYITAIALFFGYGVSLLTAIVLVKEDFIFHIETVNSLGVCFSLVIYFHLVSSYMKHKKIYGGKEYVS